VGIYQSRGPEETDRFGFGNPEQGSGRAFQKTIPTRQLNETNGGHEERYAGWPDEQWIVPSRIG
jgi:hypothetical protein